MKLMMRLNGFSKFKCIFMNNFILDASSETAGRRYFRTNAKYLWQPGLNPYLDDLRMVKIFNFVPIW